MTEHDHEAKVAAFGECPVCIIAAAYDVPPALITNTTGHPLPDPVPDPRGATYEPERDRRRLGEQAQAVWDAMLDGDWHTLAELSAATRWPEASVSARLRDFRRPEFGGHHVERRRRHGTLLESGQHEYRLVIVVDDLRS